MTPITLLEQFRKDVEDREAPYLWDDDEFLNYLADAQDMFWRRLGGIQDATSSVTTISYAAGDEFVAYSPRILRFKGLQRASDYDPVEVLNYENLPKIRGTDYGRDIRWRIDDTTGEVRAAVVGMEDNKLRLIFIPEASGSLKAVVDRLPLLRITDLNTGVIDMEEQHHLHLLKWVKHLAYSKEDSQTYDRLQADKYEQQFYAYCTQAERERQREKHCPRSVMYGGL